MPMDLTVKGSESHNFPLGKFLARKKKIPKAEKRNEIYRAARRKTSSKYAIWPGV